MGKRGKEEKYNHKTMELRIHKCFAEFKTMGIIIKGKKEKLGHYFLLCPSIIAKPIWRNITILGSCKTVLNFSYGANKNKKLTCKTQDR